MGWPVSALFSVVVVGGIGGRGGVVLSGSYNITLIFCRLTYKYTFFIHLTLSYCLKLFILVVTELRLRLGLDSFLVIKTFQKKILVAG